MADTIKNTLFAAEKLAIKIKKKARRNDLDFTVQVSVSSNDPKSVYYAAQITPFAEGIAPQTFIAKSGQELLDKMQAALDGKVSPSDIERAYHESQITHAKRTIEFHEGNIKAIDETPIEDEPSLIDAITAEDEQETKLEEEK